MAFSISTQTPTSSNLSITIRPMLNPHFKHSFFPSLSNSNPNRTLQFCCYAAKQQSGPVKKRPPPSKTKKKKGSNDDLKGFSLDDVEIQEDMDQSSKSISRASQSYQPLPLPKPPAGFVVDEQGRVLMASHKRIVTIVDSTNNFPLECIIRRVFRTARGDECMLLCPVDTPVQILKSTNIEGWSAVF
ncbi:unnamed protein product [Ilex paraguariensis]|uniref:Uncharacterized protein n=1 Tax=Ilex paraguariensis TaxID=185542 RepID=A0ABC8R321_9AQUA